MNKLEQGRALLRDMMGDTALAARDAKRNSFNATIQDYSDEVCFGTVWSRPGLDRKTRSIMNITMLVALNRPNQLKSHINIGLNNGLTLEDLREIILHCAVYAGLPAAVEGFRVAEEVLKSRGELD